MTLSSFSGKLQKVTRKYCVVSKLKSVTIYFVPCSSSVMLLRFYFFGAFMASVQEIISLEYRPES